MNELRVSVIIPNFNYGRFIGETIESALAQTYSNIEVIVADDGSTDDSVEVIRHYGDRVKLVRQNHEGVSSARNRAAAESTGGFLAFLDSDDIWQADKIEKQVRVFERDPEIGLVHCGYVDFTESGQMLSQHLNGLEGKVDLEMLRYERPTILGGGSGVVVRRSVFERVGGFDTRMAGAEDWEFFYQAARISKVGFVPEVLMKYRLHPRNSHLDILRMEKAILKAYDKAFNINDDELRLIRRQCYGKIHSVIAGSYFRAGQYGPFVRHAVRSLWLTPGTASRYLGYPTRAISRMIASRRPKSHIA